jgi:hypothetical protein
MVRQVTGKDRYARAVAAVTAWCREHRNWLFRDHHRRVTDGVIRRMIDKWLKAGAVEDVLVRFADDALMAFDNIDDAKRVLSVLGKRLSSMMRGHFAYYGVGGNSRRLRWFANQAVYIWRKWLSRRHRGGVVPWTRFNALLARHPLPSVRSSTAMPP